MSDNIFETMVRQMIHTVPTYIPGKSIESLKKELGLKKIVKMASNENPLGPAVTDIAKLSDGLSQYYPSYDEHPLFRKLAKKLGISKNQIILGNGSDEIIHMLALAFLNKGDELITADCTFSEYEFAGTMLDAQIHQVPLKDNTYDLFSMLPHASQKTKLIFIANPNNPTGTIITHKQLEEFMSFVPRNTVVVIDEAYIEYVQSEEYPNSLELLKSYDNLIILRTFSKVYGLASLRIGYGVSNKKMITVLNKVRQPFNVNSVALKAAELAFDNVAHVKQSIKSNEEGKTQLYHALKDMGLRYQNTEANFIFIEIPYPARDIFEDLLLEGVIVRPMNFFGRDNAIRVTIGSKSENEMFINALKTVLKRVEEHE